MTRIGVMARALILGASLLTCAPAFAVNDSFIYDASGRLIMVIHANGTTTSYTYDAAGNRKTVVTVNNTQVTWGNFNWNNAAWHN